MKINNGATRKALTAGCFALALVSRVEANDFSEGSWHNTPLVFSNQVYVLPTSGTLGEGLETRYTVSDNLKLRLRQASQNMSDSGTRRSVNYNLNFKIFSNSTIFDWHVFGGDFRASMGMIFGQTELSGTAYYADSATARRSMCRRVDRWRIMRAKTTLRNSSSIWRVSGIRSKRL